MTFKEFLIERNFVRKNSNAQNAGTPFVDEFAKEQIANLNAAAKESRKTVRFKAEYFRTKSIDDNKFGDPELAALSRKHEIEVKAPVGFIKKEMDATQPQIKRQIKKTVSDSNKKRKKNGGKM